MPQTEHVWMVSVKPFTTTSLGLDGVDFEPCSARGSVPGSVHAVRRSRRVDDARNMHAAIVTAAGSAGATIVKKIAEGARIPRSQVAHALR